MGSGDIGPHLEHSAGFAAAVEDAPELAIDLGSGGGVPGLVLAVGWPKSRWVLIDANRRRAEFLREAIAQLGLVARVEVVNERAEVAGRAPRLRGQADLVVARSFGPPAVTAECAAPLLRLGGILVVAEPPGGAPDRWAPGGLGELGLSTAGGRTTPIALQRLVQVAPCPDRYPRRTGVPSKRPLF